MRLRLFFQFTKNQYCDIILFSSSGIEGVTNRLEKPVPGIEDMFVSVQLSGPLLSEEQKKELNPMIIKIHSVTNMPETPLSHDQLKEK